MNPELTLPLISCICITKNRTAQLLKSIISFQQQTYPNKELVISYPEEDLPTQQLINTILELNPISILKIKRQEEESVGKARNAAITKSQGEYICMWDDDDLYYPSRLADQYIAMQQDNKNYEASILTRILFYEATAQKAFLSFQSLWECTLLCKKTHLLANPCADATGFECQPVITYLSPANLIYHLELSPALYTYIYHGKNSMPYTTFLYLINRSEFLPDEVAKNIKAHLDLQTPVLTDPK